MAKKKSRDWHFATYQKLDFLCDIFDLQAHTTNYIMNNIWQKHVNSTTTEMIEAFKARFNTKLADLSRQKVSSSSHLPAQKYRSIINRLNQLQNGPNVKKATRDYRLLKQYEVITLPSENNTTMQMLKKPGTDLLYIEQEKLFDVISPIHISSGHGGRDIMQARTKKKYANLTKETLQLFTDLCHECRLKKRGLRRFARDKSSLSSIVRRRCRVDVVDSRVGGGEEDGYRFIMMYQDNRTKYRFLKALKTQGASEVANHLVDVFCSIGSPPILDSNNGNQFASDVVVEVKKIWPQCIMVCGANCSGFNEASLNTWQPEVNTLLKKWMRDNKSAQWWQGLRFVQWIMNNNNGTNRKSPYATLFHENAKLGLQHANIPNHLANDLHTENDLTEILKSLSNRIEVKKEEPVEVFKEKDISATGVSSSNSSDEDSTNQHNASGSSSPTEHFPPNDNPLQFDYTDSFSFPEISGLLLPPNNNSLHADNTDIFSYTRCGTLLSASLHCDTICPCPEFALTCKCLRCCPCNQIKQHEGCTIRGLDDRTCTHFDGPTNVHSDGFTPTATRKDTWSFPMAFDLDIDEVS